MGSGSIAAWARPSCTLSLHYVRTTYVVDEGDEGTRRGCVGLRVTFTVAIVCMYDALVNASVHVWLHTENQHFGCPLRVK